MIDPTNIKFVIVNAVNISFCSHKKYEEGNCYIQFLFVTMLNSNFSEFAYSKQEKKEISNNSYALRYFSKLQAVTNKQKMQI